MQLPEHVAHIQPSQKVYESKMKSVKVVTINVRFDGRAQSPVPIPSSGTIQYPRSWKELPWSERPWAERRSRLVDALLYLDPDVIGMQEVLHNQMIDVADLLGDDYAYVGAGRDDGKRGGEYSPIFYKKSLFDYVDHTYKWLSTTPDVPGSKDWDASLTRIATFLTLSRRSGDGAAQPQLVHVINTHYDNQGIRARSESSLIIRGEARKWVDRQEANAATAGRSGPVILTGDFNSPPEEDGYKNMVSHAPLPSGQPSLTFSDTYFLLQSRGPAHGKTGHAAPSAPYGPYGTYTDFSRPGSEADTRIDFVFVADGRTQVGPSSDADARPDRAIVTKHAVIDNLIAGKGDAASWTGRWSDHRAVYVEVELEV